MSLERQPRPNRRGPCRSWRRVWFVFIFVAMMGSHVEGFKQGSDLTDLNYMIERFLRLPHGARIAEKQEWRQGASWGRHPRCSVRWLGLG